jgi:hypothetical protein
MFRYEVKQNRQLTCKSNIEARSCNRCCSRKVIGITYSECVCVCGLIYPARNAHVPYYIVVCLALPHYSTSYHNGKCFRKKFIEHKMCLFKFSGTSV